MRMKALWFSNSPCGSVMRNKSTVVKSGGWLISLESELKKVDRLQLEVAFFSDKEEPPFYFDGVKYYPMCRSFYKSRNGINRVRERFVPQRVSDAKVLPIMLDVIRQSKPDIIHIHGTEEAFGLIAEHVKDIPIAFSIQGLLAPYAEKFFSGIPADFVEKHERLSDKLRGVSLIKDYRNMLYRAQRELGYLRKAKYVLGRTFWDREITGLCNPLRRYFIVNEILRKPFYGSQWDKSGFSQRMKIVSTVSVGIYKGFETLLKAARLLKEYAAFEFEWSVIGYDENSRLAGLVRQMTGIVPGDCNVKFCGRLDAGSMVAVLLDSDIYCHVSHMENSPNSVCEAMVLGMPVVATNAGGTPSLLDDGKEGLLYQDGDPYILAGRIAMLASDFGFARRLGRAARERALRRHDPQGVTGELMSAYRQILDLEHERR